MKPKDGTQKRAVSRQTSQKKSQETTAPNEIIDDAPWPYRVFISYSHADTELAEQVIAHLRKIGAIPISDHEIRVGEAFSGEIRQMIECAHVFMPILTKEANKRLWVHQEIGYALALRVPVCPIALGQLPSGMAGHIHAVRVRPDGSDLEDRLKYGLLRETVGRALALDRPTGRFECAFDLYDRQKLLAIYTQDAWDNSRLFSSHVAPHQKVALSKNKRLRQSAAFTSFSIPNKNISFPIWDLRDGSRPRSAPERHLLRLERQLMEKYARRFGCDLILDPYVELPAEEEGKSRSHPRFNESTPKLAFKHDPVGTRVRLQEIVSFLNTCSDEKVNVAIPNEKHRGLIHKHLMVIGDWFMAEAIVPYYRGRGYLQTMFTHHGPTVIRKIQEFDLDFEDILMETGVKRHESRRHAIKIINQILNTLQQSLPLES